VVQEDTRQKPEPRFAATVQWVNTPIVTLCGKIKMKSMSPVAQTVRKIWPQNCGQVPGTMPMRIKQDVDANQALKANMVQNIRFMIG
jgi:hypothetical protein